MSDKPFGIDVSRWQGRINWDLVAANQEPVRYVGIRATISWGYADSWFRQNWSEAKRVGILRMAYHVVYPGESADRQINHFLQLVGEDTGELPLVLDVELNHNRSPDQIETTILRCASLIKARTGRDPIIYSRGTWVDQFITAGGMPPAWLNEYDWWLAHYLRSGDEHPGPPRLPKGLIRERCIIHQTASKGAPIGVESKSLDYNRWQFDLDHLEYYAGVRFGLSLEEKVERLWAIHPELHES